MHPLLNWYAIHFNFCIFPGKQSIQLRIHTHYTRLDTLIHLKTASIAIDVQILTHLIAYKLNTCAPHWYRENFSRCFRFVFVRHCFCFSAFSFHFSNRSFLLFYFFPFRPMWVLVFRSVPLHVMLHTTFDTYILALIHRSNVCEGCECVLVFRAICFIRSCLALVCFFVCSFLPFYSCILLVHSFVYISLHINSFVKWFALPRIFFHTSKKKIQQHRRAE